MSQQIPFTVSEPLRTSALSLILSYGATIPFIAGAAGAALSNDPSSASTRLYFKAPQSSFSWRECDAASASGLLTARQIATSMWYFTAGLLLLLLSYASLIVFDVRAASHLDARPYFARLRAFQMLIPIAWLGFLLILSGV